ncbi:MAG: YdcF family protein [Anaerolineae bacterium]|nr:YdcF family protein [Anaerolineae bacterium]
MMFLGAFAVAILLPFVVRWAVEQRFVPRIDAKTTGEEYRTAVVFGAAVRNGRPTAVLRDRLDVAIALYHNGQVDRLIMSGDGRAADYDEPGAMADYAVSQGVPVAVISLDRYGLRTYDTCYRLRYVFDVSQAVLVTQAFHLPRALFTCAGLGVDAVGASADLRSYRSARWYDFRELLAINVAVWDVLVRPLPEGGNQR